MDALERLTDTDWLGVPTSQWLWAAGVAVVSFLVMTVLLRLALARVRKFAGRTATRFDDVAIEVLGHTSPWLIALAALLIGLGTVELPERWASRVEHLWFIALAVQVALWANQLVGVGIGRYERHQTAAGHSTGAAGTLMSLGLRTLLWAVVLLAILSNLGINITAFVASLGVGGIAIALAVQNILGDLFASLSIAIDKPFEVGDFIVVGAASGTVENIGLKTTRIRSLGGEQVVMSNTDLLKQTISNYKRLQQRRIVFTFGVAFGASPEQAEAVTGLVRGIVEQSSLLRFDRVHLKGFGAGSLDYELVYIVQVPDYNVYMDEQQRINLALMRALDEQGLALAIPSSAVRYQPFEGNGGNAGQGTRRLDAMPSST